MGIGSGGLAAPAGPRRGIIPATWRGGAAFVRHGSRGVLRMAEAKVPTPEDVVQTLSDGLPLDSARLLPFVYDRLRRFAACLLGSRAAGFTLSPTDLVHAAYLKICGSGEVTFESRSHFFRVVARAVRQVMSDHARRRNSSKRGGGAAALPFDEDAAGGPIRDEGLVRLDDLLDELASVDGEAVRMLELRFFGGLTVDEIATVLGVSKATIERRYRAAKAWLAAEFHAD